MSVTKDLNQSKASEEVIYKVLVNSWRFSRHLETFASVIKDPCLQNLGTWGGDNWVQRCRYYFLKFLLEIEFNDFFSFSKLDWNNNWKYNQALKFAKYMYMIWYIF